MRYSKTYNLRRRDVEFYVGDRVWRRNKVLSNAANKFTAKLGPKYILSIVKRKHSKLVYGLSDGNGTKVGRWHIKYLKPYFERFDDDASSDLSEE